MNSGKVVQPQDAEKLLLSVIRSGDRVVIEGDNQKQAAFLAKKLASLPPEKVHDLHMLMSSVTLDDHLELFRRKIAKRLDFAFSGQQAVALAELAREGVVNIGSIHTYLELFSRYFTDLIPNVALVCAEEADADGNLFTGPNSEETPVLCEATHFGRGKVIAQVTKVVERVTRVDIPGDQVDFVIPTGEPTQIQPLFTRDPAKLNDTHVLMAEQGIFELPPVMIYGDDITHIVTEKGIAYLCRCGSRQERRAAIRAVAGQTPVGKKELAAETAELRKKKIVAFPEDLGIQPEGATTDRLAAKSIADLVDISGERFHPLPQFL